MPSKDPIAAPSKVKTDNTVRETSQGASGPRSSGAAEARVARRADGPQQGGQEGGFEPSSELEEDESPEEARKAEKKRELEEKEAEKQRKIDELQREIEQLESQMEQQLRDGDEAGAKQTQGLIDGKKSELTALVGEEEGAAPPAPAEAAGGGLPAMGGGGGGFPGGGGGGFPGGGGGGPAVGGIPGGGGGVPGGGGSSLNAPVQDGGGPPVDVSKNLEPGGAAGIPDKYKNNQVAQLIWQESKKAGADPHAMLATAIVESGLNPKAVGDNGTSFGLYQYHIGGALGNRSKEWAFNPMNIIQDEAKRFASAGVRDGRAAAAVQRPADQAGYARKVDALIAEMKRG